MSAPLRIRRHPTTESAASPSQDQAKNYVDRLVKLIPAEIVALYLAGKVQIAAHYPTDSRPPAANDQTSVIVWVMWTIVCLLALIAVRRWATSDTAGAIPPEWPAIGLTAVAFLVWIYSLGDVFRMLGLFNSLLASLILLVWTTVAAFFYKN